MKALTVQKIFNVIGKGYNRFTEKRSHDTNFVQIFTLHTHIYTHSTYCKNMHENINHGYFWCQITGDFYSFSSFSICVYVCVIYAHMHIFTYFRYTLHKYVVYTCVYLYTYIHTRSVVPQYAENSG